jgi:hypothetical protein
MASDKIVDAVSSEPVMRTTTVPVKIDTSALTQAMSKIAAAHATQQTERVDPAAVLSRSAETMADLYTRHTILRELGMYFHGKTPADPIPADVVIEDVTIRFRSAKDPNAEIKNAKIYSVLRIGDIAQLLTTEIGTIVALLQQENSRALGLLQTAADALSKAREAWNASNKDRQIVDLPKPENQQPTPQ